MHRANNLKTYMSGAHECYAIISLQMGPGVCKSSPAIPSQHTLLDTVSRGILARRRFFADGRDVFNLKNDTILSAMFVKHTLDTEGERPSTTARGTNGFSDPGCE